MDQIFPAFLFLLGLLGSMAAFTVVQRLLAPPQEDPTSLAKLASKQPGEISVFDSLNPQGSVLERLDCLLARRLGLGPKLEALHMLLGRPVKPSPLAMLHIKEVAALGAGFFAYYMSENWLLGLIAVPFAFLMPDKYFQGKVSDRQLQIRRNFPSMVDLAALTIESGLDYMTAFERILQAATEKTELEKEMEKTLGEVSLGYSRRDALRRLAMRTGLQDMRSFTGLIIQSDELGTSLVDLLRNFSSDMRFRRLNAAEKAAAKASTKMLFPIFFFIFPTVFLLVLSPMFVSMFKKGGLGF